MPLSIVGVIPVASTVYTLFISAVESSVRVWFYCVGSRNPNCGGMKDPLNVGIIDLK